MSSPILLDQVRTTSRLRHLSRKTETAYIGLNGSYSSTTNDTHSKCARLKSDSFSPILPSIFKCPPQPKLSPLMLFSFCMVMCSNRTCRISTILNQPTLQESFLSFSRAPKCKQSLLICLVPVSYTHLRAHET